MKIWGSPKALSDVTEAAGWMILDCDKNKMDQDIRLVCKSANSAEAGCDHLSQNMPPEGKIVRLPDSCGKMPFALVAKYWVPENQTIPKDAMKKIVRRDGATPKVQAMSISTNFTSGDVKKIGNVNIAIQGANFPGDPAGSVSVGSKRRSRLAGRGLFDFVGDAIDAIKNAAGDVVDVAKKGFDAVKDGVNDAVNAVEGANNINENTNKTLPALDINQDFPLFSGSIDCPVNPPQGSFSATLNVDVDTQAHAVITIGLAAVGTVVPPQLSQFSVFAGVDADINAALHVAAQASGQIDSGVKTLFEQGIPGLDFPGIFSLGPTFKVNGEIKGSLNVDVDVTVNLAYTVTKSELVFPPNSNQNTGGDFKPADSRLKLSAASRIDADGNIEGHIIPTVDVGLNFLNGVAQASVFLDLDASAILDLQLDASGNVIGGTGKAVAIKDASAGGCVDITGGLNVDAGAQGSFFSFFNEQTKKSLFSKKFELLKKCFGDKQTPSNVASAGNADIGTSSGLTASTAEANNTVSGAVKSGVQAKQSTISEANNTVSGAVKSGDKSKQSAISASSSEKNKTASKADKSDAPDTKTKRSPISSFAPGMKVVRGGPERVLGKRALGCGVQSTGTSLTSLVEQVISATSIQAI